MGELPSFGIIFITICDSIKGWKTGYDPVAFWLGQVGTGPITLWLG